MHQAQANIILLMEKVEECHLAKKQEMEDMEEVKCLDQVSIIATTF